MHGHLPSRLFVTRTLPTVPCHGNRLSAVTLRARWVISLQDIAALTLGRDLDNLRLARRSGAHSPRLPGVGQGGSEVPNRLLSYGAAAPQGALRAIDSTARPRLLVDLRSAPPSAAV
jgi:hypothetical protein